LGIGELLGKCLPQVDPECQLIDLLSGDYHCIQKSSG
jgi:hypothetical protein